MEVTTMRSIEIGSRGVGKSIAHHDVYIELPLHMCSGETSAHHDVLLYE